MNEDDPLNEEFAPFRDVMPPEDVRRRNRAVVRTALDERVQTAWWRRRMSVPLPVALAVAALLLVSLSVHVVGGLRGNEATEPKGNNEAPTSEPTATPSYLVSNSAHVRYSETQRYVSGIGVIDRNVVSRIRE